MNFILQIIVCSIFILLLVILLVFCVFAIIYECKVRCLRTRWIETLDEHDKSVICTYINMYYQNIKIIFQDIDSNKG